ncbi:MAG TPA: HlyD family efflux transporter periplasmic adaptor subunit, partial [Planctomycetota bacterium]|nr:HlyD family efflux transporter periplasmic adaptor subunit [Planctomycetota bacterium]
MRRLLQIIAIVFVLGLALAATAWLLRHPREAQRAEPPRSVPHVRALEVHPQDFDVTVRTQGTVEPRLVTSLVADVAGRIVEVASRWGNGAFFEKGDLLIQIDPSDYELAAVALEAEVAQAELKLAREREEASSARSEWERLGSSSGKPSALLLREPQLREAEALLEAAKARKRKADLDLARTRITAPFDCRVLATQVEVGQFVSGGTLLGRIYGVEYADVRVPVPDGDLAFLDLPPLRWRDDPRARERSTAKQRSSSGIANGAGGEMLDAAGRIESNGSLPQDPASRDANAGGLATSGDASAPGPQATLRARYAGEEVAWTGTVIRTEAEIDPRTRMTHLVVRVADPFGLEGAPWPAPLSPGLFVRVELAGRTLEDVIVLPRHALRDEDRV